MTNLPTSEQAGNLDNIAVTRAEFRSEIGILLEYVAQALGSVTGTYTTEVVDPFDPELQGTPTLEVGAEPLSGDSSLRLVTSQWVKRSGRYVGGTAPTNPVDGMLWIDNSTAPYTIQAFNGTGWDIVSGVASGTRMLFQQSTAPVGWTKDTSNDNTALRVTSGTVTTGGTLDFTAAFSSARPTTGTVANHTLTIAEMPVHSHGVSDTGHDHGVYDPGHSHFSPWYAQGNSSDGGGGNNEIKGGQTTRTSSVGTGISIYSNTTGISIVNNGGGQAHAHGFTGGNLDMEVKYVDVIVAEKD